MDDTAEIKRLVEALVRTQTNLTIGLRDSERNQQARHRDNEQTASARHHSLLAAIDRLLAVIAAEGSSPTPTEEHQVIVERLNKRRTGDITGVIRIDDEEFHVRKKTVYDLWNRVRPLVYSVALAIAGLVGHKFKVIWNALVGGG